MANKDLALGVAAAAALVVPVAFGVLTAPAIRAQDVTGWQTKAGGKQAFDVASVKRSAPDAGFRPPNFPLDPGDTFVSMQTHEPPRGRFEADFPVVTYITFAYKLSLAPA